MTAVALVNYPKDLNLEFQQVLGNGKKPSGIDHKKQIEYNPTVLHAECESLGQGIKSKPFFFLLPMIFTSTLFGMFMANCYKIYGLYVRYPISLLLRTDWTIRCLQSLDPAQPSPMVCPGPCGQC